MKCKNEFPKQLGFEKQIKNGVICLVFMSPSCATVLKLAIGKSKAVIAVYVYSFESSRFTF